MRGSIRRRRAAEANVEPVGQNKPLYTAALRSAGRTAAAKCFHAFCKPLLCYTRQQSTLYIPHVSTFEVFFLNPIQTKVRTGLR